MSDQAAAKASVDSSPDSRRSVWMRCSNRFIAIWRNTAATAPSSDSASSDSRAAASGASPSSRSSTIVSPKIDAVSATVSGVVNSNMPLGRASAACTPWPSSWAMVSTSPGREV